MRLRLTSLKRSLGTLPAEAWITAVAPELTWIVPEAQRMRLVLSDAPGTSVRVPSLTVVRPVWSPRPAMLRLPEPSLVKVPVPEVLPE